MMITVILACAFVAVLVFGYIVMKRLDSFLSHYHTDITEERRRRAKKRDKGKKR